MERKSLCKKYLLQNRCICTADLWEVEGGYKAAILMALDFPRELFHLQLAFFWQQLFLPNQDFEADQSTS